MKRTVVMHLARETRGALRYEGVDDDSPEQPTYLIGTLYLRKDGVASASGGSRQWPATITVTVEAR